MEYTHVFMDPQPGQGGLDIRTLVGSDAKDALQATEGGGAAGKQDLRIVAGHGEEGGRGGGESREVEGRGRGRSW